MPSAVSRFAKIAAIAALTSATVFASLDDAEARRAGSGGFGSRGTRTFQAPPVTSTAPGTAAPIERSMTPRPPTTAPATAQQPFGTQRPGLFGGFGRSMIGGLIAGGRFDEFGRAHRNRTAGGADRRQLGRCLPVKWPKNFTPGKDYLYYLSTCRHCA